EATGSHVVSSFWREGRDSNPRGSFTPPTRLAGGRFRPLSNLPAFPRLRRPAGCPDPRRPGPRPAVSAAWARDSRESLQFTRRRLTGGAAGSHTVSTPPTRPTTSFHGAAKRPDVRTRRPWSRTGLGPRPQAGLRRRA